MASLGGQWFRAAKWHSCNVLLEQFPRKYLLFSVVRVCVWAPTISAMSLFVGVGGGGGWGAGRRGLVVGGGVVGWRGNGRAFFTMN